MKCQTTLNGCIQGKHYTHLRMAEPGVESWCPHHIQQRELCFLAPERGTVDGEERKAQGILVGTLSGFASSEMGGERYAS